MSMHLPPLASLRIFEAAARLGSFREAARELGLTPSAVSHGVTTLEQWLGTGLFRRVGRAIRLTEAGEAYRPYVADALSMLAIGARRISPLEEARQVAISVAPTFASHWLVPRLPRFQAAHPQVTIRIDTSRAQVLFPLADMDLAVRMGATAPPQATAVLLFRESLTPVARPDYLQARLDEVGELTWARCTLIDNGTAAQDWGIWLDRHGRTDPPSARIVVDTTRLAMDAAAHGAGIALAREPLCTPEIESGRLVRLDFAPLEIDTGYWLTLPHGREPRRDVRAFARWICAEAGLSDEVISL